MPPIHFNRRSKSLSATPPLSDDDVQNSAGYGLNTVSFRILFAAETHMLTRKSQATTYNGATQLG